MTNWGYVETKIAKLERSICGLQQKKKNLKMLDVEQPYKNKEMTKTEKWINRLIRQRNDLLFKLPIMKEKDAEYRKKYREIKRLSK